MNTLLSHHAEVIERLGWTLVHSLWQIAAIAAALALSRLFVRSPNGRHLLAMLAMVLCAGVPVATFIHLAPEPVPPARETAAVIPTPIAAGAPVRMLPAEVRSVTVPAARPVKISHVIIPSVSWRVRLRRGLPWAVAAWVTGMGFIMLRHLAGLWSLHVLRTRGLMAVSQDVKEAFEQTRLRLGVRRVVRVFESARVLTPLVVGTLKPVVLLPASVLTGLAPCQLEALFAHELAHLRRWDDLANLLQCAIETLLFYHPALWWISRIAREERELCCDDLAIERGVKRHDLAQALGRIALWHTPVPQPALAATGHMPVLARIRRLLQPTAPALAVSPWPVAAVVLLASMLLLAAPQSKAQIKPSRGRIMDRNGLVLAESDAEGVRRYPYRSLAAHIIGYTGLRQLRSKELAGRSGIEQAEDKALFAKADVLLTLDARLQQIAESTLINVGWHGACVVIDPSNGDILAMASVPGYDLNSFIPFTPAHIEALTHDPGTPLLARAYQGSYFPASTFKLVTALAALKSGAIDENTMFEGSPAFQIGERVFHNWNKESEGMLNVEGAIKRSCNTWFYQAALKTGAGPILDVAAQLGFGQPTGLPIPETKVSLPSDDSYMRRYGYKILPHILASMSIGQIVEVSPLQAAVAMGALANGGKVWTPRLLLNQPASRLKNNLLDHGVRPAHLDLIKKAMVAVVNGQGGTGHSAQVPGVLVTGKTGTAQWKIYPDESKNRNLAWFTGFAPADHPRLAFALVYEGKPGEKVSGGGICAPMVKTIVEESLAVLDGKKYEVRPQAAHEPEESDPTFLDELWMKRAEQKVFANHVIFYYSWANPSMTGEEVTSWHFGSNVLVAGDGEIIAGNDVKVDSKGGVEVIHSKTRPMIQPGTLPTLEAVFAEHGWLLPKPKPKAKTAPPAPAPGTASAASVNDGWPFQSPVSASDPLGSYPFIANQLQPDTAPLRTLEELKRPKGFWDPMELSRVQPLNIEMRMKGPMAVDAERLYQANRPASHFDQALISR